MTRRIVLVFTCLWFTVHGLTQRSVYSAAIATGWRPEEPINLFGNNFRIGLMEGAISDVPLSGSMTVQAEIVYSMFGSYYSMDQYHVQYKANYLMFPVLSKYHLGNGFSLMAGPQLAALVNAKANQGGTAYAIRHELGKADVFFAAGIEYEMKNNFVFSFRYERGLLKTSKRKIWHLENRGFSLKIRYRIDGSLRWRLKDLFR